jgi:hypothetical protein
MEVIMESHPALESISRKGDLHSINKCLSTWYITDTYHKLGTPSQAQESPRPGRQVTGREVIKWDGIQGVGMLGFEYEISPTDSWVDTVLLILRLSNLDRGVPRAFLVLQLAHSTSWGFLASTIT